MRTVGIDIGGTKIAGGLVERDGRILRRLRVDTPRDPRDIVEAVAAMSDALSASEDVGTVGVAAAGFVDRDRSTIVTAPNIAWRDEPLRDTLQTRLGRPVLIENDANAAGWAEYRFGAGRDVADLVMLTLGTGVGGAIIADGELYRGSHGIGGELGHARFVRGGLACGCGQNGCLEQYASGRALEREAEDIARVDGIGSALAATADASGRIAGAAVSDLVVLGDAGAIEALRRVATALGEACGGFQAVLDPDMFVLGGGVSELGDLLLDPVTLAYQTSLPGYGDRPVARFAIAELGNDAGIIGVADLARRSL